MSTPQHKNGQVWHTSVIRSELWLFHSTRISWTISSQTFAKKCQLENAEELAAVDVWITPNIKDNITFRVIDIKRLLRNLKSDKATGPDEIPRCSTPRRLAKDALKTHFWWALAVSLASHERVFSWFVRTLRRLAKDGSICVLMWARHCL